MINGKELKEKDMDQVNGGFKMPFQDLLFKTGDNKEASVLETENIQKDAVKLGRAVTMPVTAGQGVLPGTKTVIAEVADPNAEKPSVC